MASRTRGAKPSASRRTQQGGRGRGRSKSVSTLDTKANSGARASVSNRAAQWENMAAYGSSSPPALATAPSSSKKSNTSKSSKPTRSSARPPARGLARRATSTGRGRAGKSSNKTSGKNNSGKGNSGKGNSGKNNSGKNNSGKNPRISVQPAGSSGKKPTSSGGFFGTRPKSGSLQVGGGAAARPRAKSTGRLEMRSGGGGPRASVSFNTAGPRRPPTASVQFGKAMVQEFSGEKAPARVRKSTDLGSFAMTSLNGSVQTDKPNTSYPGGAPTKVPSKRAVGPSKARPVSARHTTDASALLGVLEGDSTFKPSRKSLGVLEGVGGGGGGRGGGSKPRPSRPKSMHFAAGKGTDGPDLSKAPVTPDDYLEHFLHHTDNAHILDAFWGLKQAVGAGGKKDELVPLLDQIIPKLTKYKNKRFLDVLKKNMQRRDLNRIKAERDLKVVVVGGGPVGLRAAIEAFVGGAETVTVIERRSQYTRHNALLLWDTTLEDLNKWGIRTTNVTIAGKQRHNIRIQDLERFLLRIVLLYNIEVHFETEYLSYKLPSTAFAQRDGQKLAFEFDVLIGVEGEKSKVREQAGIKFERLGAAREIYGMTANFEPPTACRITEEIFESDEIISGGGPGKYRKDLNGVAKLLHLPNPTTWYCAIEPNEDAATLLKSASKDQLHNFARDMGNRLGITTPIVDVAFFEVTIARSDKAAVCKVTQGRGAPAITVIDLEGDSLMNPFWYLGTGVNKGYLNIKALGTMMESLISVKRFDAKTVQGICDKKSKAYKDNANVWK